MTNDKMRQDFEAWWNEPEWDYDNNCYVTLKEKCSAEPYGVEDAARWGFYAGNQAGHAARDAEIREKLEAMIDRTKYTWSKGKKPTAQDWGNEMAIERITKILEVI